MSSDLVQSARRPLSRIADPDPYNVRSCALVPQCSLQLDRLACSYRRSCVRLSQCKCGRSRSTILDEVDGQLSECAWHATLTMDGTSQARKKNVDMSTLSARVCLGQSWWSPGDNDERVDDQDDDAAGPGDDGGIAAAAAAEKRSQAQGPSVDEESTLTGSEWARGRKVVRAGSSAGSGPESHPQPGLYGFACNSANGPRVPSVSRTRTLGSVGEAIDEEPSV